MLVDWGVGLPTAFENNCRFKGEGGARRGGGCSRSLLSWKRGGGELFTAMDFRLGGARGLAPSCSSSLDLTFPDIHRTKMDTPYSFLKAEEGENVLFSNNHASKIVSLFIYQGNLWTLLQQHKWVKCCTRLSKSQVLPSLGHLVLQVALTQKTLMWVILVYSSTLDDQVPLSVPLNTYIHTHLLFLF